MSEVILLRFVLTEAMGEKDGLDEICLQKISGAVS